MHQRKLHPFLEYLLKKKRTIVIRKIFHDKNNVIIEVISIPHWNLCGTDAEPNKSSKLNKAKNPIWLRPFTSWLFTSAVRDLNPLQPGTNPAYGSQRCQPLKIWNLETLFCTTLFLSPTPWISSESIVFYFVTYWQFSIAFHILNLI